MKKITSLFVLLMLCCISKWTNAQYVPPTHIDGAAPNGILWDSVLTGRTLPVRTTTVGFIGVPGAVMFYDKATGIIGINPNGLSINFVVVTYTAGNININANTPGPFIYPSGTGTGAYSPSTGTPRTFPAVTAVVGLPPTTQRARFGGSIGSPLGPSLATTGDANNIASSNGFLNLPWSFGKVVNIDSLIANNQALVDSNFKVVGQNSHPNANLLGYGPTSSTSIIKGCFQYSINGVSGTQVGPVIVYSSVPSCTAPTLSSIINNTSCSSLNDGSINLTATNGSPAPTFAWSGPNSFTATTEDLSALAAGSYTVVATSGTCTSTATYTVVAGAQPTMPTLACYETATFNITTCSWVVTGTQPTQPTLACYETANFNTNTCVWDVTGTQPVQPTLACYESANFNTNTCLWDVTGSQPTQPTLACYESANFNTGTCSWDVTGTQPLAPTGLACYETATFNTTSCSWDVTGSVPAAIVTTTTGCDSYTWSANGQAYTQSGTYSYYANCQDYTLNLTITTSTVYYADVDGDGYGNPSATILGCNGAPNGYVAQSGDCNDTSATAYPGANEICGNGIDDDCDSQIDEGASVFANPIAGNLKVCGLYAGATTLTTPPIEGSSTYNWTVPSDMTITSGQGTTTITVFWDNIYLLQNGIVGNVTVTPVLSTAGCTIVVPASIPVDLQYTAPVTPPSISGPNTICPNESGVYSIALVNRASAYEWSLPTGASITSGLASNIINVSYGNGFTGGNISVRSKNVCGLSASLRNRNVTLNVLPAPASITGPANGLCSATNSNYLVTPVVGASGYNWTVPATGTINSGSNSNNISVNFNSSFASGNITVAAVNNCGVGASRSLAVRAVPATPGTITGPASACAGSTQSYGIQTVQGASNYIWTVPGGAVINGGQGTKNLSLNFGSNASTNGTITVKSSNTCGASIGKVLAVVTTICPRLGEAVTQLQVYPNPANDYINVSFNVEETQQATIILRDAAGRVVYNENIYAAAGFNNQQIELSSLSKGVYFVQLQTASSSENTRLIIK
jgi:hypothetical protein